jgi:hypothetical protein
MLVIPNSQYGAVVPIQLGTLHLQREFSKCSDETLLGLPKQWRMSLLMLTLAKRVVKNLTIQKSGVVIPTLDGDVKLKENVKIEPFETKVVKGVLTKKASDFTRLMVKNPTEAYSGEMQTPHGYLEVEKEKDEVGVAIRNQSARETHLLKGVVIAKAEEVISVQTLGKRNSNDA